MPKLKRHLLLVACFTICGCNLFDCSNCDVETRHGVSVGGGVVNDSMAIFTTFITENEFCSALGEGGSSSYNVKDCKLLLADIRTKKVYWEKKIPNRNCGSKYLNTVQDSILIFEIGDISGINRFDRIAFLKLEDENFQQANQIDLKSKEIKIKLEDEDWKRHSLGIRFRPWQNGLILVNAKYVNIFGNYYALLDTATGIMEPWNPSGEFEWLNECADARWSSVGGLCLKEIPGILGFVLLRNGTDTLAVRYIPHELSIDSYEAEYMPLIFSGNGIISRGWVYLMNGLEQVSEKPLDIWIYEMGTFYDLDGNKITY